jgi:hypothetical protein
LKKRNPKTGTVNKLRFTENFVREKERDYRLPESGGGVTWWREWWRKLVIKRRVSYSVIVIFTVFQFLCLALLVPFFGIYA